MVQKCFKWQFFTEGSFIRLMSEAVYLVKVLQDNLFYFSFFFTTAFAAEMFTLLAATGLSI